MPAIPVLTDQKKNPGEQTQHEIIDLCAAIVSVITEQWGWAEG